MAELPEYAVLDGGVTTEIIDVHGMDDLFSDPLWSTRLLSTNPAAIQSVHKRFLEAGSDIIETVTYQASVPGFQEHLGLSPAESLELIKSAVVLAQKVRDQFWEVNKHSGRMRPLVAGSVSPYGAYLADGSEYDGNYVDAISILDLIDWHRPVVQALLEAGVDILALESIPAQKEAKALIMLLREFPDARVMLSLNSKDGQNTPHGEKIADVFRLTIPCKQVVVVGINCTSPVHIEPLLKSVPDEVRACKKLAVYPNSGEKWDSDKKSFSGREDCPEIAPLVTRWLDNGANWVGGCCRTYSKDIVNIRKEMQQWLEKKRTG